MSSFDVPIIQCVHVFEGEVERLEKCIDESTLGPDGLCCLLYGLWTHSSNVVVQLVVSMEHQLSHAEKHKLECIGFVARSYSEHLYQVVEGITAISRQRQHVIVDVSNLKTKSLRLCRSHPDYLFGQGDPLSEEHVLQVNILADQSPYREQLCKFYPEIEPAIYGFEMKSESNRKLRDSAVRHEKQEVHRQKEVCTIDRNSLLIKSIILKIKSENLFDSPNEIWQDPSFFILWFEHCSKIWKVEFKADEDDEIWIDIFYSKCDETVQVCSHLQAESQLVIDTIKNSCNCEICKQ